MELYFLVANLVRMICCPKGLPVSMLVRKHYHLEMPPVCVEGQVLAHCLFPIKKHLSSGQANPSTTTKSLQIQKCWKDVKCGMYLPLYLD